MTLITWARGYQVVGELPHRDRLRCATCRRWTRTYVLQGLDESADDDATARRMCPDCAKEHRG